MDVRSIRQASDALKTISEKQRAGRAVNGGFVAKRGELPPFNRLDELDVLASGSVDVLGHVVTALIDAAEAAIEQRHLADAAAELLAQLREQVAALQARIERLESDGHA